MLARFFVDRPIFAWVIAIVIMLAGALLFALTFFFISIACDYRYLVFLDFAAMAGALYTAARPA